MTGREVASVDFTSSLFLGMRHPSSSLAPWREFTTGVPAILREFPSARRLAVRIAREQDAAGGLTARSTLHALIDVLETLTKPGDLVLIDSASYPTAWWSAGPARTRGVIVRAFPHHHPEMAKPPKTMRTWFVTDGWCPGCNRPAPIGTLKTMASETGGCVIVDDSLGFGILGQRSDGDVFGDGTGTIRWCGASHRSVIWLASLAKAYGTPLAVVTAEESTVHHLLLNGGNRAHASPPSSADIEAGIHALKDPARAEKRRRLRYNTLALRRRLISAGLRPVGLPFPVVTLPVGSHNLAVSWWHQLRRLGLHVLVQQARCSSATLLTVVVRTEHGSDELDRIADALGGFFAKEALLCSSK